jgi:hypothetical protein
MSARKYFFVFPLIVFVALLFFSITTNEASPNLQQKVPEDLRLIIEKIKAGPAVDDSYTKREKLAEKIQEDYAKLKDLFDNERHNFGQKMAMILGKKATLLFEGETYRWKNNGIKDFWIKKRETYDKVEFDLEWAFIVFEEKETKEIEEMPDYDHIAYEHFTFKLLKQEEGEILKNLDGDGERSCRHTQICDCITR